MALGHDRYLDYPTIVEMLDQAILVPEAIRTEAFHRDVYLWADDDERPNRLDRNRRQCPLCSKQSAHLMPAAHFPQTPAAREKLTRGFFAEKKKILCRDFEASLARSRKRPHCPRKNDCPYAHLKSLSESQIGVRSEPYIFGDPPVENQHACTWPVGMPVTEALTKLGFPEYMHEFLGGVLEADEDAQKYPLVAWEIATDFREDMSTSLRELRHKFPIAMEHADVHELTRYCCTTSPDCPGSLYVESFRMYDDYGRLTCSSNDASHPGLIQLQPCPRPITVSRPNDTSGELEWIRYSIYTPSGRIPESFEHGAFLSTILKENLEQARASDGSPFLQMTHVFDRDGFYSGYESIYRLGLAKFDELPSAVVEMRGVGLVKHHFFVSKELQKPLKECSMWAALQSVIAATSVDSAPFEWGTLRELGDIVSRLGQFVLLQSGDVVSRVEKAIRDPWVRAPENYHLCENDNDMAQLFDDPFAFYENDFHRRSVAQDASLERTFYNGFVSGYHGFVQPDNVSDICDGDHDNEYYMYQSHEWSDEEDESMEIDSEEDEWEEMDDEEDADAVSAQPQITPGSSLS